MGNAPGRAGVLLINTGSPGAPEPRAVGRYLAAFLMDAHIRPLPALPWWLILHAFILPKRKVASAEKYRAIWTGEGSPLVARMTHLASGVEAALARDAGTGGAARPHVPVRAAMVYGEPSARAALDELRAAGCDRVVAVPLYPQSAHCTTGAALAGVERALRQMRWQPDLIAVERYAEEGRYLGAIAESVSRAGFDPARDQLLFSFHSAPVPDVRAGDTYPAQAEATARRVSELLGCGEGRWSVAYQSPFEDRRTWIAPFTVERMAELGREGCRSLYLVCPGFSCDCLETLWDVEHELKPAFLGAAQDAGFDAAGDAPNVTYVPCLNDSAKHVDLLAHVIEKALTSPS